MKLYSDSLTQADLFESLPKGVDILVLEILPKTRKRRNGWIVHLTGSSPFRSSQGNAKAATWDEHGLWMAELYRRDPGAIIGQYRTRADFYQQTKVEHDRVMRNMDERYRSTHRAPWLESQPEAELVKQRDNTYWIGAQSQDEATRFAEHYGVVESVRWAGPGHYRSDVYIVEVAK